MYLRVCVYTSYFVYVKLFINKNLPFKCIYQQTVCSVYYAIHSCSKEKKIY